MTGLDDQQIANAARHAADKIYVQQGRTAVVDTVKMEEAIKAIDACMVSTTDALAAKHPGKTVEQAINQDVTAVAPELTLADKGVANTAWTAERSGLAPARI